MKFSATIFTVFILWLCPGAERLYAQVLRENIKIKIAQSYERTGDHESALKIYEEAFLKDSLNPELFDAIKRNYLKLKRYDDAVILLKKWLKLQPNDVSLLAQLGSIYILASNEPEARAAWEHAINTGPKREMTYILVGSAMVESRQFERAIEIYKRGRKECGNPALFTNDIAYLYSIMLNYTDATLEYIHLLRQSSAQLAYVQSRIAAYTGRTEGLTATTLVVSEAVKNDSTNITLQMLLAWLYMEGKDFNRAYNVYKVIDKKTNAGGRELFAFAERALREKSYEAAIKAYSELISGYPKFNQMAQAKFGLARTLEEAQNPSDTVTIFGQNNPFTSSSLTPATFANALAAYQSVVTEYPNTEVAARALLHTGIIMQEKINDLDGARKAYEAIRSMQARYPSVEWEVKLRLGDVYLAKGNLDLAEKEYKSLSDQPPAPVSLRDRASFHLAQLDYFNEDFKNALIKLDSLTKNPQSDVTNDALLLKLFLQEQMKNDETALKKFIKAELLRYQMKLSEALAAFESLAAENPSESILETVYINTGDILTIMHRYNDAVTVYERIMSSFPEGIYTDQILMKMGQIFELGLNNREQAVAAYERLLEKYTNSIFAGEARKRIRILRGDNI